MIGTVMLYISVIYAIVSICASLGLGWLTQIRIDRMEKDYIAYVANEKERYTFYVCPRTNDQDIYNSIPQEALQMLYETKRHGLVWIRPKDNVYKEEIEARLKQLHFPCDNAPDKEGGLHERKET